MTNVEAIGWIELLIDDMVKDTTGPGASPKYKDEVYTALNKALYALKNPIDDRLITRRTRENTCES